ncbi:hypothetical protein AgCh_020694 [Apium graveolens]
MGNCLAQQDKLIQVMKTDGKILEYKQPLRVHQVLSEHAGHAISQTLPVIQHLCPDANMHGGRLYYLVPLLEIEKKYYNTKEVAEKEDIRGVRIKLVIRRQDLEMLSTGAVSVEDMISQLKNQKLVDSLHKLNGDCNENRKGWKPALQSIPESC